MKNKSLILGAVEPITTTLSLLPQALVNQEKEARSQWHYDGSNPFGDMALLFHAVAVAWTKQLFVGSILAVILLIPPPLHLLTTTMSQTSQPVVYQGQFGEFTITEDDRRGVIIYRAGLMLAALSFAIGSGLILWQGNNAAVLPWLTPLYTVFCLAIGVSLATIHIYMEPLHRALQVSWGVGALAAMAIAHFSPDPFALTVYSQPLTILGVGFLFAALTGIYFKEAFCFNRLETKLLTPLVPILLLGHLVNILPPQIEQAILGIWAVLFLVFALRKVVQPIPSDIGDKSVFTYLHQQKRASQDLV